MSTCTGNRKLLVTRRYVDFERKASACCRRPLRTPAPDLRGLAPMMSALFDLTGTRRAAGAGRS